MLALFASLFILLLGSTQAKHSNCSWQPWADSPLYHRFYLWCVAQYHQLSPGKGQYICTQDNGKNTTVADWGVLRPNVLEWGTPCGKGGYAYDWNFDECPSSRWAMCLGSSCSSSTPGCYWMSRKDDCEWPTHFDDKSKPANLEVWAEV